MDQPDQASLDKFAENVDSGEMLRQAERGPGVGCGI